MALVAGSSAGPYRIVEPLGRGGMASVYKAYEAKLDRYVALKVLPREFLHDPSFAQRFRQEAQVIAKLEHPNIIPIYAYDIEEAEGIPWMAMRLGEQPAQRATRCDGAGRGRAGDRGTGRELQCHGARHAGGADQAGQQRTAFRALANSGQALVWTSGLDGGCEYFYEPWLRFTGRTQEQEQGEGWAEGVHPDDRLAAWRPIRPPSIAASHFPWNIACATSAASTAGSWTRAVRALIPMGTSWGMSDIAWMSPRPNVPRRKSSA